MPFSTDVRLPKDHQALFPNRCVACGIENPDGKYKASTHAIGWWTIATMHFGKRFVAEVPACLPCAAKMRRRKWQRLFVEFVICLIGVKLAMIFLGPHRVFPRKWIICGITLVIISPFLLWRAFNPQQFDMTAYENSVDYEFLDAEYALEFAALNGTKISEV